MLNKKESTLETTISACKVGMEMLIFKARTFHLLSLLVLFEFSSFFLLKEKRERERDREKNSSFQRKAASLIKPKKRLTPKLDHFDFDSYSYFDCKKTKLN